MAAGLESGPERSGIFYGWVVVGAAFVVLFLGFGSAYSFGIFFDSLQAEFAASRGSISLIFSLAGFLYFLLGALSGRIADRVGPRGVVIFGAAAVGVGLILASRATSLTQVYVAYCLGVGLGVGFAYVPAVGAIQRWFVRRRGVASGIAVTGIGLGTLCMPPVAAMLIDWGGWRGAYLVIGIVALTVGGAAAFFVEGSPERRGLLPDGDPVRPPDTGPGAEQATPAAAGVDFAMALRARPFWLLYAGSFLVSLGIFIPFVHLVPYARDAGLSKETGVLMFALVGLGSTAGRFVLGGVADRVGRRRTLAALFAGMGVMLLWWAVSSGPWALGAFALVFGTCYGGFVALAPAVTADYFDGKDVIGIIGVLYTSVAVGTLTGPTLAGVAFDLWQSYTVPIVVAALVALLAAACIALAEEPAAWRRRALGS
jgi:MFS family permease